MRLLFSYISMYECVQEAERESWLQCKKDYLQCVIVKNVLKSLLQKIEKKKQGYCPWLVPFRKGEPGSGWRQCGRQTQASLFSFMLLLKFGPFPFISSLKKTELSSSIAAFRNCDHGAAKASFSTQQSVLHLSRDPVNNFFELRWRNNKLYI